MPTCQYNKMEYERIFEIIHNLIHPVTLAHFVDTPGNDSHSVTVSGVWIFDTNKRNHSL